MSAPAPPGLARRPLRARARSPGRHAAPVASPSVSVRLRSRRSLDTRALTLGPGARGGFSAGGLSLESALWRPSARSLVEWSRASALAASAGRPASITHRIARSPLGSGRRVRTLCACAIGRARRGVAHTNRCRFDRFYALWSLVSQLTVQTQHTVWLWTEPPRAVARI